MLPAFLFIKLSDTNIVYDICLLSLYHYVLLPDNNFTNANFVTLILINEHYRHKETF